MLNKKLVIKDCVCVCVLKGVLKSSDKMKLPSLKLIQAKEAETKYPNLMYIPLNNT